MLTADGPSMWRADGSENKGYPRFVRASARHTVAVLVNGRSAMVWEKHVGQVGALAVALGIGSAAVAMPGAEPRARVRPARRTVLPGVRAEARSPQKNRHARRSHAMPHEHRVPRPLIPTRRPTHRQTTRNRTTTLPNRRPKRRLLIPRNRPIDAARVASAPRRTAVKPSPRSLMPMILRRAPPMPATPRHRRQVKVTRARRPGPHWRSRRPPTPATSPKKNPRRRPRRRQP